MFKLVGNHPEDLADGRIVGPGEVFEMETKSSEDNDLSHNKRLVDEGLVIEVEAESKRKRGGDA